MLQTICYSWLCTSTGRWTTEEHTLFLQGLQQYNKQWKQIAELVKTRTVVQIRTHAQKYFQKIDKMKEGKPLGKPSTFSAPDSKVSNIYGVKKSNEVTILFCCFFFLFRMTLANHPAEAAPLQVMTTWTLTMTPTSRN